MRGSSPHIVYRAVIKAVVAFFLTLGREPVTGRGSRPCGQRGALPGAGVAGAGVAGAGAAGAGVD
jgi:hypothetical protein